MRSYQIVWSIWLFFLQPYIHSPKTPKYGCTFKCVRYGIALTLHVLDWSLPSNNFELQTCDQDFALYFYIASAQNWVFPRELNCFKLYNLELRWRGLRLIWHNFVSFLRLQLWHREHTQIWHSLISVTPFVHLSTSFGTHGSAKDKKFHKCSSKK